MSEVMTPNEALMHLRSLLDGWDAPHLWMAIECLDAHLAKAGEVAAWPIRGRAWDRRGEWVLELEGSYDDTAFFCRHTETQTTARADVAALPSLYAVTPSAKPAQPVAAVDTTSLRGALEAIAERHNEKSVDGQIARAALAQPRPTGSFDFAAHLQRQRDWSGETFGPGSRAQGVVDHIRKELLEIEADPGDLKEWIDVVILALDGAWRSGAQPQEIVEALVAKQTKNEDRVWPDWRTADPNKAIEHDRSHDVMPHLGEGWGIRYGGRGPDDHGPW